MGPRRHANLVPGLIPRWCGRSPGPLPGLRSLLERISRARFGDAWQARAVSAGGPGTTAARPAGTRPGAPRAPPTAPAAAGRCGGPEPRRDELQAEACGPPLTAHRTDEQPTIFPPAEHFDLILLACSSHRSQTPSSSPAAARGTRAPGGSSSTASRATSTRSHKGVRLRAEDAEDVFQEVFARTYQHLDRLRDDEAIRPWIAQLTRRLSIDKIRAGSREELSRPRDLARGPRRDDDDPGRCPRRAGGAGRAHRELPARSSTASSPGTRATRRSAMRSRSPPARSPAASPAASQSCGRSSREEIRPLAVEMAETG